MALPTEVAAALYGAGRILTASIKLGLIDKMTARQVAVLLAIPRVRKDSLGATLVEDLGIPLGSVSRIIDSLVDLRLLEKSTNPEDARRMVVDFTPAGVDMMTKMAATNYRFRKGDVA
jgi:DNA-binding MarR family transcriptional regulator